MKNKNSTYHLPSDWSEALKDEINFFYLDNIIAKAYKDNGIKKTIFPCTGDLFNAFKLCKYKNVKVVIFGQDPYHQKGYANGLAFSVNRNQKIPASLKNIYKEVRDDIGSIESSDGNLDNWAKQGVLLLNTALTVEINKPGSHASIGWNYFIEGVIKNLRKKNNIVYFLWGNHAKKMSDVISNKKNLILKTTHPSPFSANKGFFGCKHFSKCNRFLINKGICPIVW